VRRGGRRRATRKARRGRAHRHDCLACADWKSNSAATQWRTPKGLRLAAPCLDGSAAHPVSPGPQNDAGAARAVCRNLLMPSSLRATSEIAKTNDSHPDRRRVSLTCSCRRKAGACRLSVACACNHARRFRVRAGPSLSKRRTHRSGPERRAGPSASSAPLCFSGGCGVSPLEGVGRDGAAARAQGKAFPKLRRKTRLC